MKTLGLIWLILLVTLVLSGRKATTAPLANISPFLDSPSCTGQVCTLTKPPTTVSTATTTALVPPVLVYVNGILQKKGIDYQISGTKITFILDISHMLTPIVQVLYWV